MSHYDVLRKSDEKVYKDSVTDEGIQAEPTFAGFLVRQDWLDGLEMPLPVMMEDWHTMLKGFKDNYHCEEPHLMFKDGMDFITAYGIQEEFYQENGVIKYGPLEEAHTNEEDIRAMAEAGWNCVRVVLDANALLYEEPGIRFNEKAFAHLDHLFDWCKTYKIYVILDMHASVGGINGCCGDALFNHYPNLLMDEESKERQILLWEEFMILKEELWLFFK